MWFWFFCISNVIILFLIAYIRWLIKQIESSNIDSIETKEIITNFSEHLSSIYEMEMFYGDQTLKNLIEHAKVITDKISEEEMIITPTPEVKDDS